MPNMGGNLIKKWHRSGVRTLRLWVLVSVWIGLKVTESHVAFSSFFFFSCAWTVQKTKNTVYALFMYFYTLFMGPTTLFTYLKIILLQCFQFSVFSFSNNKFNPNGPLMVMTRGGTRILWMRGQNNNKCKIEPI